MLFIIYDQFGISEVESLLAKLNPRVLAILAKQIPEAEKMVKHAREDLRSSQASGQGAQSWVASVNSQSVSVG